MLNGSAAEAIPPVPLRGGGQGILESARWRLDVGPCTAARDGETRAKRGVEP
jgi:hypothetical protein